ncbi:MAG TPA: hypothetical protein VJM33_07765 [Microthrixaceae bacterium]|nr:hypothetical protein [Microthrixaceae bacterium]
MDEFAETHQRLPQHIHRRHFLAASVASVAVVHRAGRPGRNEPVGEAVGATPGAPTPQAVGPPTLADLISGASSRQTIALDQTSLNPILSSNFAETQIRVGGVRDVIVDGGVDPSRPRAQVLSAGLSIYEAVGWTFRNINWIGQGNAIGSPSVGALLQMNGGRGWKVLDSEFRNSRAFGQFAVGDDNGDVPKDWELGRCAFFGNGNPQAPGAGHTSEQEHMIYVVTPKAREQRGSIHDCSFHDAYQGATVKLGGVNARSGCCIGVDVTGLEFHGHHLTPLLFAGKVKATVTNVVEAPGIVVSGQYKLHSNGPVSVVLTDVVLPGHFFQNVGPRYEDFEQRRERHSPRTLPTGTDSYHVGGELVWFGLGDNGATVGRPRNGRR